MVWWCVDGPFCRVAQRRRCRRYARTFHCLAEQREGIRHLGWRKWQIGQVQQRTLPDGVYLHSVALQGGDCSLFFGGGKVFAPELDVVGLKASHQFGQDLGRRAVQGQQSLAYRSKLCIERIYRGLPPGPAVWAHPLEPPAARAGLRRVVHEHR